MIHAPVQAGHSEGFIDMSGTPTLLAGVAASEATIRTSIAALGHAATTA